MRRILLATAVLLFCGAVSAQADATTLKAVHPPHRNITFHNTVRSTKVVGVVPKRVASGIPVKGNFIDPDTGLHCHNTGWATICDGGVASGDEGPSATDEAAEAAAQQASQDATDITNAGIAQTVQGINGP